MFRGVWVSPKGRKDVAVKQFKGISLPSDEMKELSFLQTCRSAELDALVKHVRAALPYPARHWQAVVRG